MFEAFWWWTPVGAVIVLWSLLELFLTIFHQDHEGPLTHAVHRAIWWMMRGVAQVVPSRRRGLVALAGPLMVLGTLALWVGLFVVGFALVVWPHLQTGYRAEPEIGALGFVDALYYSGVTGTVLGYGDITPVVGWLKVVAFVQAAYGFLLLSGAITYLLSVISALNLRGVTTLRVRAMSGGTGEGVLIVARSLRDQDPAVAARRIEGLAAQLWQLQESFHQFPLVDVYYRSRDPGRDLEPMLRAAGEAALAARLVAADPRFRVLRPGAEEMEDATVRIMRLVAQQYLGKEVERAMETPRPEPRDEAQVDAVRRRVEEELGVSLQGAHDDSLAHQAFRLRVFLDAVDRLTGWRRDDDRRAEQD